MAATKIMLIRHAEKPPDDGSAAGVSQDGTQDVEELIVRGWQRSGALIRFFAPANGQFAHPRLKTPNVIFASAVAKHSNSLRPQHTVLALAQFLKIDLDLNHLKGDEDALASDAIARDGTVLIAWEHQLIPKIANQIMGNNTTCPQTWPGERFDLVWIFDRASAAQSWTFTQAPQQVMPGDRSDVIPTA
jgi:hypothetical protein